MTTGIDLLLADHVRVADLFDRFAATGDAAVIGQILDALAAHDEAEHAALYPLTGHLLGDADLVERMSRAHSEIKRRMEHLRQQEGPALVEDVTALRRLVEAHVHDEEASLFPRLTEVAPAPVLDGLGARIQQNRQRVG